MPLCPHAACGLPPRFFLLISIPLLFSLHDEVDLGGKPKPNVHLVLDAGESVKIDATEDLRRYLLSHHLPRSS
jgi:hypothetical protein